MNAAILAFFLLVQAISSKNLEDFSPLGQDLHELHSEVRQLIFAPNLVIKQMTEQYSSLEKRLHKIRADNQYEEMMKVKAFNWTFVNSQYLFMAVDAYVNNKSLHDIPGSLNYVLYDVWNTNLINNYMDISNDILDFPREVALEMLSALQSRTLLVHGLRKLTYLPATKKHRILDVDMNKFFADWVRTYLKDQPEMIYFTLSRELMNIDDGEVLTDEKKREFHRDLPTADHIILNRIQNYTVVKMKDKYTVWAEPSKEFLTVYLNDEIMRKLRKDDVDSDEEDNNF